MYEKPSLQRFGTFRELTMFGFGLDETGLFFGICLKPTAVGGTVCRS
ncbi:MAG: lasso RiPP family leader peptide-containing protein [Gemmatimonadales bacterium]